MRIPGGRSRGRTPRGDVGRCSLALLTLATLGIAQCGGRSVAHVDDGEGAQSGVGGNAANGGSGAAANGGTGGTAAGGSGGQSSVGGTSGTGATTGDCYYRGAYYDIGDEFIPEAEPCTTCYCNNVGVVICTDRDCASCVYEGAQHPINASFPARDGCNSCSCNERGEVSCTDTVCDTEPVCYGLKAQYTAELDTQKRCPPRSDAMCVVSPFDSLPCGCDVAVYDPIALEAIARQYFSAGCGKDSVCPPCPFGGLEPFCADGTCVLGGYL